jgi:hypothetical protein
MEHIITPEAILALAEKSFGVQTWLTERAACGDWPVPETVSQYLGWIEDEAAIQEQQAADHPDERQDRLYQAISLRVIACALRCLGVQPSPLPWEVVHA